MWCTSCAELIKLILLRHKGVKGCIVDYATDLASIEFYPQLISKEDINNLIQSLGYLPKELSSGFNPTLPKALYWRFLLAAFCALNVMMFAYPLYAIYFSFEMEGVGNLFTYLSFIFAIPVITYCAYPIFQRCYHGLKQGIIGMEALVALGALAAFILSTYQLYQASNEVYFDSMTVIIAFVLLGKMIEAKAKFSSKEMLFRLYRALPQKARKIEANGEEKLVPLKEVAIGDLLAVHSGEKIVLDGVIQRGQGACDESLVTGESMPIYKQPGMQVIAGAHVQSGSFTYKVERLSDQSTMQKILTLIENDIGKKTLNLSYEDRIAKIFTPLVLFLALITYWTCGILAAIAVLLISCPCAIGIAAPLAESHLISKLAQLGALVRNRNVLRFLGKETVYVFDKTGTVTEGNFHVLSDFKSLNAKSLSILKTLTVHSAHPLSFAISQAITAEQIPYSFLEEIPGKGLRAIFDGQEYLLGSHRFLTEEGFEIPLQTSLSTSVFYACEGKVISIYLGDKVREEAKELKTLLAGKRLILLSGDHANVVQSVAKELSFDEWRAEVTPFEKKTFVDALKAEGHIVFMMGDGINDAAAIASAHIGCSLVSAAEISIQVSDILFTGSLRSMKEIFYLGRKGHKILKQNIFWAFFYNIIGIGLAVGGLLSPIFSAFAMNVSSLIVLLNSKRI
jgi:heavy metal translocating P-type ATPase